MLRDFRVFFSIRGGLVFKEKRYLIKFDTRSSTSSNLNLQSIVLQHFQVCFSRPGMMAVRMIAFRKLLPLTDRTLWDYIFVKNSMEILLIVPVMVQMVDIL